MESPTGNSTVFLVSTLKRVLKNFKWRRRAIYCTAHTMATFSLMPVFLSAVIPLGLSRSVGPGFSGFPSVENVSISTLLLKAFPVGTYF
jgi:hypothetical protein